MTKALMGLENLACGMENSATCWSPDASCNTSKMIVDGLKMAVYPQSPAAEESPPAVVKSSEKVIDLTDEDALEADTPVSESQTNGTAFEDGEGPLQPAGVRAVAGTYSGEADPPSPSNLGEPQPKSARPSRRIIRRKPKRLHPDDLPRFPKDEFSEYLGLCSRDGTTSRERAQRQSCEVEDLTIDVDDDEEGPSRVRIPHTPTRSSKRLLSQCRDFSPPPITSPKIKFDVDDGLSKKKKKKKEGDESEGESDTDSDASDESFSDKPEWVQSLMRIKISAATLFAIDITSPLGKKIKDKYVYKKPKSVAEQTGGGESDDEFEGYERYCHTPKRVARFMDRLRNREVESYPVTFNWRKRISDYQCHWIKFTWRERLEFLMVLKTGLTARARRLVKRIKPCSVKLKRITDADVRKWRRPPRPFQRSFPQHGPFSLSALAAMYPLASMPEPVPEHLRAAQMQQRMLLQQQLRMYQRSTGPVMAPPRSTTGGVVPVHLTKNMFAPQMNGQLNSRGGDSDLICISSDEEDSEGVKATSSANSGHKSPAPFQGSAGGGVPSGVIRFKCHLCTTEIHGQLGSTDFIAEHFRGRHNVHNIRLHQSVDSNGQTVVTIVQDIPNKNTVSSAKPATPVPNVAANKTPADPPSSANNDDVICID